MEDLGFQIGEPVLVKCEDGRLIITPDTMRAETKSREKEFLDHQPGECSLADREERDEEPHEQLACQEDMDRF